MSLPSSPQSNPLLAAANASSGSSTPCDARGHPGNNYYVNKITGEIQRDGGWPLYLESVPSWSGPFDWCQAKANASSSTVSGGLHGTATGGPLGDIGGFFHALGQSSTWVRVGEVLAGILVLYVGLRALTQGAGGPATKASTGLAKKTVKVVRKVAK